ncbi:MAG: S49 family peptidase, partial [Exilibacterium sp.]
KNAIDFELLTAGEHKRTLTIFGENTEKGREKFIEELEDTHELFKTFVNENRSQVEISEVATGEVWYGRRAIDKKLIDGIQTSDDYIWSQQQEADIYEIEYVHKKSLPEKLGLAAEQSVDRLVLNWWEKLQSRHNV